MTLSPAWRTRLFAAAGAVLAVVLGVLIANEAFFWPTLFVGALAGIIAIYIQPLPLPTVLLGGALIGYIVGNRGFAQFSLAGSFPLLPAEFVLLVGVTLLCAQSAWHRDLPIQRNLLNMTLFLWMVWGTMRFMIGIGAHGFASVRDYALVYYGVFFFIAQHAGRDTASARFLETCIIGACVALLVIHPLFSAFQNFFLQTIAVRGIPLIYFKGDLAGNFMAVGSVMCFVRYERSRKLGWVLASLALAGLMLTTNSRSSMVGLAVGAGWLALSGRWKFASLLGTSALLAAVAMLLVAYGRNEPWERTPLYSLYERVASIVDPFGQRAYATDDSLAKGDNNAFRLVWWRASINETLETNPWFGLGFGHDLAQRFVLQYYPEGNDDFSARSPHNVLITIFARMGIVGFTAFVALMAAMAVRTWRVLRNPGLFQRSGAWWCAAWVLLTCACFGVVLEGPMGAVVFWIVVGLASALSADAATPVGDQSNADEDAALQEDPVRDDLLVTHSRPT